MNKNEIETGSLEDEANKAITCLYIAVDASIADDVKQRVGAFICQLKRERAEAEQNLADYKAAYIKHTNELAQAQNLTTFPTHSICSNPACREITAATGSVCSKCLKEGKNWSLRVPTAEELLKHFAVEITAHSECHCEDNRRDCLYCIALAIESPNAPGERPALETPAQRSQ